MQQLSKDDFAKAQAAETNFDSIPMDLSAHDPAQTDVLAGYDPNSVGQNPRFALDPRLFVQFYSRPKRHNLKSRVAGRPIFDNVDYVKINVPGDKHNEIDRPADSVDIARFPRQYAAYKAGASQNIGIPLSVAGFIPENIIEELKFFKITTVEQLANLTDANAQHVGGGQDLKQRAQKYLSLASTGVGFETQQREIVNQQEQLSAQAKEIQELKNLVKRLAEQPNPETKATEKPPQLSLKK